jgi:TolA-binding protein
MSETITYWEFNGFFLSRQEINTGSYRFYVKHDEKTVSVKDPDFWGNAATETFYRNFEDAKKVLIDDLESQISKLRTRIEEMKDYKEV